MPRLTGLKAFAMPSIVMDQDDEEDLAPPDVGISPQ